MTLFKKWLMVFLGSTFLAAMSVYGETYKIGFSGAMTGPTSDAGVPYSRGITDYCAYVNDTGMLGDDKLECLLRDDGYKNDTTKRNFEEFLDEEILLFLGYATGATLALKEDFEEEQIPVIPASMHADNVINSNYIFLPIASYSEQALGLVEYIAKNHTGGTTAKIAMFIHPSAFGRAPLKDIEKAIEAGLKAELVEVVEHGKGLDNTAMLKRLTSKGVQYVVMHTVQAPVASVLRDASRLSLTAKMFGDHGKLTFLGAHYTGGNDLIALSGESAEGFLWVTSYRMTHEDHAGSKFITELAAKYNRDEKTKFSHNYTNGVMVTQLAVEAMIRAKKSGDVTRESMTKALNGMNASGTYDPKTTVGAVTFSETDRFGVDILQLYQAKGGVFNSLGRSFQSKYFKQMK